MYPIWLELASGVEGGLVLDRFFGVRVGACDSTALCSGLKQWFRLPFGLDRCSHLIAVNF